MNRRGLFRVEVKGQPSIIIVDNHLQSPLHSRPLTMRGQQMNAVVVRSQLRRISGPATHISQCLSPIMPACASPLQIPGPADAPDPCVIPLASKGDTHDGARSPV
jgi:hypothetical protein